MKTRGYSFWLELRGNFHKKFSRIIRKLSKQFDAPSFEPHVTLLGSIEGREKEIIVKTKKLASGIKSFKLRFASIEYQRNYFRALFIKVRRTKQIIEANKMARKIFKIKNKKRYMPHLSLLYGKFPISFKKKIIKEIGKDFKDEFEVKSLHLWKIDGKVNEWRRIKEFKLFH